MLFIGNGDSSNLNFIIYYLKYIYWKDLQDMKLLEEV